MDEVKPEDRTVERLNELLDQKDSELEEVREELEKFEAEKERREREWLAHRRVPAEDDAPGLPVPRLQFRYVPSEGFGWQSYEVVYELVYRHFLGRKRIGYKDDPDLLAIPLGTTRVNGGGKPVDADGKVHLPFRDGTHIVSDAEHLRLPMFTVLEGKAEAIKPRDLGIEQGR